MFCVFAVVPLCLPPWVSSAGSSELVRSSRMERELEAERRIPTEGNGRVKTGEKVTWFSCPFLLVGRVLGLVLKHPLKAHFVT